MFTVRILCCYRFLTDGVMLRLSVGLLRLSDGLLRLSDGLRRMTDVETMCDIFGVDHVWLQSDAAFVYPRLD